MSFSDHFISKYINKNKESSDSSISASLIPPKMDLLDIKNEVISSQSNEEEKEPFDEEVWEDDEESKETTNQESSAEEQPEKKQDTAISIDKQQQSTDSKTNWSKITKKEGKGILQKQVVTPNRIAWAQNKVKWRKWMLTHNDKLPTPDGTIYSPVNGTVVWVYKWYKENKNKRSLRHNKKATFGNYVVIKIADWPMAWLTYHLGHIDKDIPVDIWSKVSIGDTIGSIKYGSWTGTGVHYSDAIGSPEATSMSYQYHGWYVAETKKLANCVISHQGVVFNDGTSHDLSWVA